MKYRKMIRSGMPAGEVMELLKAQGYSIEEINKVFKASNYDLRGWLFFFSLLPGIAGIYLFIARPDRPLLMLALSSLLFGAYLSEVARWKREENKISGE